MYRGVPKTGQPEDLDGKLKVEIHHIRVWIDDVGADGRSALQKCAWPRLQVGGAEVSRR